MAVYTDITDSDAENILAAYDIGRVVSLKGIAEGVENSNFFLKTDRGEYILTIYEKRVEEKDLPFFLGLTQHLAKEGVSCAQPVAKKDGSLTHHIYGKPMAIIEFLLGTSAHDIQGYHLPALGEAMGRLHLAASSFPEQRSNPLSLEGWQRLYDGLTGRLDTIQPGLQRMIDEELRFLHEHWPTMDSVPHGVIHADLFPDNVFFDHDRLTGIIDFYFACTDMFAYELAIVVNAWCFRGGMLDTGYMRSLLNAYNSVRPLKAEEYALLPVLLRGAALRFLLTRAHDWLHHDMAALVRPKNPLEYVHKLATHQHKRSIEDYGL